MFYCSLTVDESNHSPRKWAKSLTSLLKLFPSHMAKKHTCFFEATWSLITLCATENATWNHLSECFRERRRVSKNAIPVIIAATTRNAHVRRRKTGITVRQRILKLRDSENDAAGSWLMNLTIVDKWISQCLMDRKHESRTGYNTDCDRQHQMIEVIKASHQASTLEKSKSSLVSKCYPSESALKMLPKWMKQELEKQPSLYSDDDSFVRISTYFKWLSAIRFMGVVSPLDFPSPYSAASSYQNCRSH